jgi:ABC-type uncharacterized transport system substrate-binding protein
MAVHAFLEQTHSVPMLFVSTADPVTAGYVGSYAHPGGITTGFTCCAEFSLASKWLDLLKQVVPSIRRVAFMFNQIPHQKGARRSSVTFKKQLRSMRWRRLLRLLTVRLKLTAPQKRSSVITWTA